MESPWTTAKFALVSHSRVRDHANFLASRPRASGIADDASQWRRSTPLPAFESRRGGFPPSDGPSGFDQMGIDGGVRSGFGGRFAPSERPPLEPSVSDVASDWRTGKPIQGLSSQRFGFGNRPGGTEDRGGFGNWRSSEPGAAPERRKLQLKPRSAASSQPVPTSTASSNAKSNPFGAAKPVDVSGREREVQEKIQEQERAIRQNTIEKKVNKPVQQQDSWRAKPSEDAPSA